MRFTASAFQLCKSLIALWIIVFVGTPFAKAQNFELENKQAYSLSSPYQAMYVFYDNTRPDNYHPARASLAFNPYTNFSKFKLDSLATQLKQIINGKGLYIDLKQVPTNPNFQDTTRKKAVFYPFKDMPEIYLEQVYGRWYFSSETLEKIPKIHANLFPFKSELLIGIFPKQLRNQFILGLSLFHYTALVVVFIAALLLYGLLAFAFRMFLARLVGRLKHDRPEKPKLKSAARAFSIFLVMELLQWVIPIIQFPAFFSSGLLFSIDLLQPVFLGLVFLGLVDVLSVYLDHVSEMRNDVWYEQIIPFLRTTLQILIVIATFVLILGKLNVNVVALFAGLSLGGLAIALAAQDTFKNLFGSVTVFLDRPFQVGDWIVTDKFSGEVELIGLRSTRIRTIHDSLVHVPNGKLTDMIIDNWGMRVFRMYKTVLQIKLGTPRATIEAFVLRLREIVDQHPHTRKEQYMISLFDVGPFAYDVLFYAFIAAPTYNEELRIREGIILQIIQAAEQMGVSFAVPTQQIVLEPVKPQDFPLKP